MKQDTLELERRTAWVFPKAAKESDGIRILHNAIKQTLGLLTKAEISEGFITLSADQDNKGRNFVICSPHFDAVKDLLQSIIERAYSENVKSGEKGKISPGIHYYFIPHEGADASFWAIARLFNDLRIGTIVSFMNFLAIACAGPKRNDPPTKKLLRDTLEARYFHSGATEIQELLLRNVSLTHKLMGGGDHGPAIRLLLGGWCSGDVNFTSEQIAFVFSAITGHQEVPMAEIAEMEKKVKSYRELVNGKHISKLSDHVNGRKILLIEDRLKEDGWDIVIPIVLGAHSPFRNSESDRAEELEAFRIKEGDSRSYENDSSYSPGKFWLVHCRTAREAMQRLRGDNLNDVEIVLFDLYSSVVPHASHSKGAHPVTVSQDIWELVHHLRKQNRNPTRKTAEPAILVFTAEENPMAVHMLSTELGMTHFFFKLPSAEIHKGAYYASFRNAMVGALTQSICQNLSLPSERRQNDFTRWLMQFRDEHRPLILRLMRHFRYFTAKDVITILGNGINEFVNKRFQADKPRFWISYLGRPNKSGPATLSLFGKSDWFKENASSVELLSYSALQQRISWYKSCQIQKKEIILRENKKWLERSEDIDRKRICVLLLDDVIGTGGQVRAYFPKLFVYATQENKDEQEQQANMLLKNLKYYEVEFHIVYALGVGTEHPTNVSAGLYDVDYSASLSVIYCPTSLDILDPNLQNDVINVLKQYPRIVETRCREFPCEFEPLGWKGENDQRNGKGNGGLFSTYANTPGNTLPIIWGNEKGRWECLFSRVLNPSAKERDVDQARCVMECKARDKCILYEAEKCRSRIELEAILERDDPTRLSRQ